jgi:hypothetical protein
VFFKTVGMAGPCIPTTTDRALILAGQANKGRLFVTFKDYLRALGKSEAAFNAAKASKTPILATDLIPFLRSIGKKIVPVLGISSEAGLIAFMRNARGVLTFSVRMTKPGAPVTAHRMLAYRNALGQVVFDNGYGGVYRSLAEVAEYFRRSGIALIPERTPLLLPRVELLGAEAFRSAYGMALVGLNLLTGIAIVETLDGPELAIELGMPPQEAAKSVSPGIVQAAGGAVVLRGQGKPVLRMPPIEMLGRPENAPPRPDWLTGVQWRLNAVGHGAGPVDGLMGPMTRHAVKAFQREQTEGGHRMGIDGIPGPRTQRRLVEVLGY